MRTVLMCLMTALVAMGCTSDGTGTTTTTSAEEVDAPADSGAETPVEAVSRLVDALESGDIEASRAVVTDEHLDLFVAVEVGNLTEAGDVVNQGVSPQQRENFWLAFIDGVPGFGGAELGDLEVGDAREFAVGESRFAFATVRFPGSGGTTEWVLQLTDDGWRVDLIGSFGTAFASAMRQLVAEAGAGPIADAFRAAAPSVRAALTRQEANSADSRVLEELDSLLEVIGST